MKICILTPRFPFPENGGDVLRINNVARYLKAQSHYLILISFAEETPNLRQAYQLYDQVITVRHYKLLAIIRAFLFLLVGRPLQCGYYHSRTLRQQLRDIDKQEQPRLYISHLLRMTPYLDNHNMRSKSIIEMTDALSKTYQQSIHSSKISVKRFVYMLEFNLIKRYENYAIKRFPKCVLVSQNDVDYLTKDEPCSSVVCHGNGVYSSEQPMTTYNPNKICFIGNMRTLQNQDAAIFFAEEVLPLVLKARPNAIFYIVGAEPPARIRQLTHNNHVVVTDFVDNVEDVISDACVNVAPVRIAAGVQNKVLVALGQRVPAVLSSLIAQAIPELHDGDNCLIKDNPREIAEACLLLMNDSKTRNSIAEAGYQMVKESYQWKNKLDKYEII
ncbi:MAG: glycosyltransferase family 4 protein [Paludibacteraceae bacterium]|nr:glycosyltransferase family 4 protein [Paludibacteraceae bacterium]